MSPSFFGETNEVSRTKKWGANRKKSAGERPKTKLSFDQEAKLIHYEQNVSQNSVFLGKAVVLIVNNNAFLDERKFHLLNKLFGY